METFRGRRALLPVIYGGAVLLLLLVALFLRGFNREVGDARLAGRYSLLPLLSSRSLENLTFSWNGMILHFTRSSTPGLSGFETAEGTTDIVFAGGARLRLSPGSDVGGSISVSPVSSTTDTSAGALVVPFTVAGILTDPPKGAGLAWRSEGKTFLLSLPASARVDTDARTISLPLDGTAWTAAFSAAGTEAVAAAQRPAQAATARPTTQSTRLPDEKALPTADKLQAAITAWTNEAYAGWSDTRYAADSSQWRLPDGSLGFSEDIGVGFLAESVARGTWKAAFSLWTDAFARQRSRSTDSALSFATAVFVGGTRDYAVRNATRTSALVDQARGLLGAADNSFLRIPGVIPLLLDHGTPDLAAASLAFITGRNASTLDLPSALGLLEALVDQAENIAMVDPVRRALQDVVNRRILPAVRATDQGLFLETASGVSTVSASARCGALLLRAGVALADTRTAAVGRGLLVAALGLSDSNGILPATLRLSSGKITSKTGTLAPEALYSVLPTGRLLPHEVALVAEVGPGVSLWTAAEVAADRSGPTLKLVFAYPAGVPHYFVIQGIGSFTQVQVHGIPWHADPGFAKYSDGWWYDGASRMFHGKLTGRTGKEEIDITF